MRHKRVGAACLVACAVGLAQDVETYVSQIESMIRAGAVHGAPLFVDKIASNSTWARRICAAAVESKLDAGLREKDRLRSAADGIAEIGTKAAAAFEGDADALQAKADGVYFKLRVRRAIGEETGTDDWLAVADALSKLHALAPDGGKPLERAVKVLREGRKAKGADAERLRKEVGELCTRGMELYPENEVFRADFVVGELDAIEAMIGAKEFKEAKARLETFLEGVRDDTHYNDAVTLSKRDRATRLRAEYRTRSRMLGDLLMVEVPRGKRWKVVQERFPSAGEIRQYDRKGELKRKFTIRCMKRNTWYVLGDTKYDGSNVKGMALITERDVLSVVLQAKRHSKIIKRRLNRKIGSAQFLDIGGLDKRGDYVRFRSYLWKGNERPWLTYRLWVIEWEDLADLDPEAELVLKSFREQKYEKKK